MRELIVGLVLGGLPYSQALSATDSPVTRLGLVADRSIDQRTPVSALSSTNPLAAAAEAVVLVVARFPLVPGGSMRDPVFGSETGSGVLVTPCVVLTARHVLGAVSTDQRSGRTIQITLFDRSPTGETQAIAREASVRASGSGSASWTNRNTVEDWSLLELDRAVPTVTPISLWEGDDCCNPRDERQAALIGFPVDKFDALAPSPWVDPACRVTERLANSMLATNCLATSGNSGGPLLVERATKWQAVGILTRGAPPDALGRVRRADNFVLPITRSLRRQINEIQAKSQCEPPARPPASLSEPPMTDNPSPTHNVSGEQAEGGSIAASSTERPLSPAQSN